MHFADSVTVYVRQFVEIALANLIINPTSAKVTQRFGGGNPQKTPMNAPAGGRGRLGPTATGSGGGQK